jgi:hypothetical protein
VILPNGAGGVYAGRARWSTGAYCAERWKRKLPIWVDWTPTNLRDGGPSGAGAARSADPSLSHPTLDLIIYHLSTAATSHQGQGPLNEFLMKLV